MRSASIAQVKNSLSSYIREVQKGKEIVVTNRGEFVAKIVPIDPGEDVGITLNERQKQMVREGLLILPKKRRNLEALFKLPIATGIGNAVQAVLDEREEGY